MSYEGDLVATYDAVHKRLLNGHRDAKGPPSLSNLPSATPNPLPALLLRMEAIEEENKTLRKRIQLLEIKTEWKPNLSPHYSQYSAHKDNILIDDIFQMVTTKERVSQTLVLSPQRFKLVCDARNIIYYLAALYSRKSLPQIAAFMKRDHTTIMHGRNKISRDRKTDDVLDSRLNWYEEQIACLTKAKSDT